MTMIKKLIPPFLAGYLVLAVAIGLNALAIQWGIPTWYGLFEGASIGVIDGLFLFFIYPFLLGLSALVGLGAARRWQKNQSQDHG